MSDEENSIKVAYVAMIAFAVVFALLFYLAKYVFM